MQQPPYDLGDLRDLIVKRVEEHERLDHGGELCVRERLNALAFVAHSLGFGSVDPPSVWYCITQLMKVYEANG